ncbi:TetR/AcrR family transcriptional regulator [Streptomyces sp. MUM 203J]|uniref:ScbR family autoregulator-binding transcription factor n=1 Tax=Streptomyces sp. MUM 203J TaxID=2791990 RepID=UPI001F035328|nr:ScbR family autoregulator-binding transcription factor [Streptomyces sp. MUM 203J]MCH0538618.1 TetR/AcrR family transcriptional regulator [Streptomyces sp. MUM 203J]
MTKQARAVHTRRALVRSAAGVFGRRGYAEATLSMISSGAGVSAGALHFHFDNKAAIGAAVERSAAGVLCRAADEVDAQRRSALQSLVGTTHAYARALSADIVVRAGFQLARDTCYAPVVDLRREWRSRVRRLIAEAVEEEALLPGVTGACAAAMVIAATTGFEELGQRDPRWLAPETLDDFWHLALPCVATETARSALR